MHLTYHFCQSSGRDNVSCVHQAIEMPCGLLDLLPHVVIAVKVEDIRHQIQRILIVLHFCVQARKVEAIRQVLFVNLAEVLVASRGDELESQLMLVTCR